MTDIRRYFPGLLPLALSACMQAGPADSELSASASPIGVDLGSSTQHMADRPALAPDAGPMGAGHERGRTNRSGATAHTVEPIKGAQ